MLKHALLGHAALIGTALYGWASEHQSGIHSGPMVGWTSEDSCLIWSFNTDQLERSIICEQADVTDPKPITGTPEPAAPSSPVRRHRFSGLKPSTTYQYQVRSGTEKLADGSFTTAPPTGDPATFSYAMTSCMDAKRFPVQQTWDHVLAEAPSFHLLVGDNVYADTTEPDVILRHHLKQRAIPNFGKLLATTPNLATWDDHDFGPNDSHGKTPGKENSLAAFKQLWANPAYGTRDTAGIFFKFQWADVDFFVMDGRYHRTDEKAPNRPDKTQFGKAQLDWLFAGLKTSRATFKVVVSGYDIMGSRYPDEIGRIARRIRTEKITGILFHSGDIHRNEFKQQDHGMGYLVTQITSSGIARNPKNPWAMIDVDTTASDPSLSARFFHNDQLQETHTIRLSDLSPSK